MPAQIERLYDERERELGIVDEITAAAEGDERDLSDAERDVITRSQTRIADQLDPQIALLEGVEITRAAHARASSSGPAPRPTPAPAPDAGGEVIYRTFGQYARDEMIRRYDGIAQLAGPGARERAGERIARAAPAGSTLTTDVPGLVVPQHLAEILDVISTARPAVESFRRIGLTSGKLEYPKIAQRPTVGKQAGEKETVAGTPMKVDMEQVPADTYLGVGDLSWQTIQWSNPDALSLWFDLAGEAYAEQTEIAATADLAAVATSTPVATDDLAGWFGAIATAAGVVYGRSRRVIDTIWADITSGFRLAGLVGQTAPAFAAAGAINLATAQGNVGGVRLVVSPSMPAGTVVVGSSRMALAAETPGAPVQLRAIEVSIAGYEVGVVGAFASVLVDVDAFEKLTPPVVVPGGASAPASGGK